jgi:HSP20 family protein
MTITHYHPWTQAHRIHGDLRHVFGRLFNDETKSSDTATSQWTPRVDIREEDQRFVILADIPGIDPKDIEINMDKGMLTIKGERKSETNEGNGKLSRIERLHGVFQRSFALPDSADADGITATGKHGVLEIAIPKKPETTPRRITISH